MNLSEQVAQLQVALPKLKANDQDFAISLIASFKKWNKLSPKQEPWIGKLLERTVEASVAAVAPVQTVQVGSFEGVIALFAKAKAHLKFPKITLLCLGQQVTLAVAGPTSKAPGSINVMGEGKYPVRQWHGRVSPEGVWTPSPKTSPEMLEALQALLTKLSAQPARVAKEHGKLTGNCCFCGKGLSDEKSLAAGFGPVCADHYGLKTEWKLAAAKGELAAGTVASEATDSYGENPGDLGDYVSVLTPEQTNVETAQLNHEAFLKAQEQTAAAEYFKQVILVKCFFCEQPSETTVIQGYTVCSACAKQLS